MYGSDKPLGGLSEPTISPTSAVPPSPKRRMPLLWQLLSGAHCLLLMTDGSRAVSSLHRELVSVFPLVSLTAAGVSSLSGHAHCPFLLMYSSVGALPTIQVPGRHTRSLVLITWHPPSSEEISRISSQFSGNKFLWISDFDGKDETYRTFETGSDVLQEISETEAGNFLSAKRLATLPNYNGKRFTVAAHNYSVYVQIAPPDEDGKFRQTRGIDLLTLFMMCEALGLRPEVSAMVPWDSYHKNGTQAVPGIRAEVARRRVDAGIGGIWYRSSMVARTDVLNPWKKGCYRYLVPRPEEVVFTWMVFLTVFGPWVWILILCLALGLTFLLVLFTKLSLNPNIHRGRSAWYYMFTIFSVVLQAPLLRRNWSGPQAPLVYSWVYAFVVLGAAFGGTLSSTLMRSKLEDQANSLRDFLQRGFYHIDHYTPANAGPIFGDKESTDYQEWIYKRSVVETSLQDRIDKLKTGKYVILGESLNRLFVFLDEPNLPDEITRNFVAANRCFQNFYTVTVLPYGSPYTVALNAVASRLNSGGLIGAHRTFFLATEPYLRRFVVPFAFVSTADLRSSYHPLSLSSMAAVLGTLIVGLLVSSCCFLVELYLGYKCKARASQPLNYKP